MQKQILLIVCVCFGISINGMDSPDGSPQQKKAKKKNIVSRALQSIKPSHKKEKKTEPHPLMVPDILGSITQKIFIKNNWHLSKTRTDIRHFASVNKASYNYYTSETVGKNIVRLMAIRHNLSDVQMANWFGYPKISEKILHLVSVTTNDKKHFTPNDLQDKWYLDATHCIGQEGDKMQLTLLLTAIFTSSLEKTKSLIAAGINCNSNRSINPIALMAGQSVEYDSYTTRQNAKENYFSIIRLLLEKGVDPDSRTLITLPTLLHKAAYNGDEVFARFLLEKGANPYKLYLNFDTHNCHPKTLATLKRSVKGFPIDLLYTETDNNTEPWNHNAFTLAEDDWLKIMYDEIVKLKQ